MKKKKRLKKYTKKAETNFLFLSSWHQYLFLSGHLIGNLKKKPLFKNFSFESKVNLSKSSGDGYLGVTKQKKKINK